MTCCTRFLTKTWHWLWEKLFSSYECNHFQIFYWFSSLKNSKYTFNGCSNNISIYRSLDKDIHMKIFKDSKYLKPFMINPKVFILLNYKNLYMSWSNLVESGIIVLMNTSYKKGLRIMRFVHVFLLRKPHLNLLLL